MTNEGTSWGADGRRAISCREIEILILSLDSERWRRILTSKYWTQRDGGRGMDRETSSGQELPDNQSVYLTLPLLPTHRKLRAKSSNKICFYSQSAETVFTCLSLSTVHTCECGALFLSLFPSESLASLLSWLWPRDHPALAHSPCQSRWDDWLQLEHDLCHSNTNPERPEY